MSLEKKIETGLITIIQDGTLQVREDTVVYEDNIELSRTYNRYVLNPGDDISSQPQRVQDVANAVWTPEIIASYKVKFDAIATRLAALSNQG